MSTAPAELTAEEKKLEKILVHEEKAEAKAIDHAISDLKHIEKAETKAEKATDKAVHKHEKAVSKEHSAAKSLNKAESKHDAALSAEKSAAQTIQIKQKHQAELEQDVAQKKAALEQLQHRKDTGDAMREAKRNEIQAHHAAAAAPDPEEAKYTGPALTNTV